MSRARGRAKCESACARGSRRGANFPTIKSFNGSFGIGWRILLTPSPLVHRWEGWGEIRRIDFFDDGNTFQVSADTQQQIALFLASDGTSIVSPQTIDPTLLAGLFEVPIVPPLPEDLNYLF
jgi:hypothetical protein